MTLCSHETRRFHEFLKDSLECVAIFFLSLGHQSSQINKLNGKLPVIDLENPIALKNSIFVRDIVKLAT